MTPAIRPVVAALVVLLAGAPPVLGQNPLPQAASKSEPPAAAQPAPAADPLGRDTPAGTVMGFLAAARGDWPRATTYLDTKLPQDQAEQRARELKVLLDRGLNIDLSRLSRSPEGEQDGRLGAGRELVGTVKTRTGTLDILLARVQRGEAQPVWLFAPETLRGVPAAYEEYEPSSIERFLPDSLTRGYGARYVWWARLVFVALVAGLLLAALLLTRVFGPVVRRVLRLIAPRVVWADWAPVFGPARWVVFGVLLLVASGSFLTVSQRYLGGRLAYLFIIVSVTWMSVRFLGCFARKWAGNLERQGVTERVAVVRLAGRLEQGAAIVVGGLAVLKSIGIDLTPVLAGLGVGGIAVAFAAQKTLENLFGGLMLIMDKPMRVGDFCRVADQTGTVEDIGLRSTRIRTLSRTVVSVPNGQLAVMNVENYSLRDKFWLRHQIGVRYETSADQLRYLLAGIRRLLYAHPRIERESARIRFIGFGGSSLDFEIFAYVRATEMAEFLGIQEDLLLRIMDIIAEAGTSVAFPSQTTYLARDTPLDPEKQEKAVSEVRQWRERGELPFPDLTPEQRESLADGIEYPPPGSALKRQAANPEPRAQSPEPKGRRPAR